MVKPEPKLTHMPEHIKQKITDSVQNVGTTLAISQMSKELLSLAKDSRRTFEYVIVQFSVGKLTVILKARFFKPAPDCFKHWRGDNSDKKKLVIEFSAHEEGVLMRNTTSNWTKILPEKDYRKAAVQYALGIMGPKTLIKQFKMRVDDAFCDHNLPRDPENRSFPGSYPETKFKEDRQVIVDEMERLLRGCKHQLLVNKIWLKVELKDSQLLQILPYFEPGTLENFDLFYYFPNHFPFDREHFHLTQISETEQWKKAKQLKFKCHECDFRSEMLAHFEDLHIYCRRPSLTMKAVIETFISRPKLRELSVKPFELFDYRGAKDYLTAFEPTKLECEEEDQMKVEMVLSNEPKTRISMLLLRSLIKLNRL